LQDDRVQGEGVEKSGIGSSIQWRCECQCVEDGLLLFLDFTF